MATTHGIKTNRADYDVKNISALMDEHTQKVDAAVNYLNAENIELPVDGWVQYSGTGDLVGYYVQVKTVSKVYDLHGEVGLVPASTLPTAEEQSAFAQLDYVIANNATNTVTFACDALPVTKFTVYVKGITI